MQSTRHGILYGKHTVTVFYYCLFYCFCTSPHWSFLCASVNHSKCSCHTALALNLEMYLRSSNDSEKNVVYVKWQLKSSHSVLMLLQHVKIEMKIVLLRKPTTRVQDSRVQMLGLSPGSSVDILSVLFW